MANCHSYTDKIFFLSLVGIYNLPDLADSLHHPHSKDLKAGLEVLVGEGFYQSVV